MPVLWGTLPLCLVVPSKCPSSPLAESLLVSVTPILPLQTQEGNINSGADGNFIAASLAADLHLSSTLLQTPLLAKSLNGLQITNITQVTSPVSLLISDNHQETTVFHILYSPEVPIVLGHPWLVLSAMEEPMELPDVPPEYLDLKAVFSKAKATCLSPHRPYDMFSKTPKPQTSALVSVLLTFSFLSFLSTRVKEWEARHSLPKLSRT